MATTSTPRRPTPPPSRPKPGNGRRPAPRRKGSALWRAIVMVFQFVMVLLLASLLTLMVWVGVRLHDAPTGIDLDSFTPAGITYIYSSDGTLLAKFFLENRKVVTIDQIPKDLQNATVAFEDKRFYTHSGVDFQGIFRAMSKDVSTGNLRGQGGSTITQQLARNMGAGGLTRQKSLARKFNELIIAHQIEQSYTKQDILAKYLNQVNYGSGAYGVEAAAETYFGKDVSKLDLAQCAMLAGLPNRPATFSPYKDKEAAKGQRNRVLDDMLAQDYITPKQFAQALKEPIRLAAPKPPAQGSQVLHAPYFVDYVVEQLKQQYGKDYLLQGNLQIYTTLNWPIQQIAEQALQNGIANAEGRGPTQGALVALDPKNGEIKAMVGGVDYKKSQFNIAADGLRQPGSSFKAIVYSAAINDGSVNEQTRVYDAPVSFPSGNGGKWTPHDDTHYSYNHVTLRTAMAQSINVPAVRVMNLIGPQTAVRYAKLMGIHSYLDPVLSLALGSSGVTPLEMADVYATFASGGDHPEPMAWTRLADSENTTIEDVPPTVATHVLQKSTVDQLDDMLRAVVTEGTGYVEVSTPHGSGMLVDLVPDARGKTGTTQNHKDVWFVGYTPELVCAVWAGHPIYKSKNLPPSYGEAMASNAFGGTVCAPIWADFMQQALPIFKTDQAKEEAKYRPKSSTTPPAVTPALVADPLSATQWGTRHRRHRRHILPSDAPDGDTGTRTVNIDDNTGLLAPEGAQYSHHEAFPKGAEPNVLSPQYQAAPVVKAAPSPTAPSGTTPAPDTPSATPSADH